MTDKVTSSAGRRSIGISFLMLLPCLAALAFIPAVSAGPAVTSLVSLTSAGAQGNGDSYSPAVSADGRYITFATTSGNFSFEGDNDTVSDIFRRDTQAGTTTLISRSSFTINGGAKGNGDSQLPVISADGRYVAFQSGATNLHSVDTDTVNDVFLRDVSNRTTALVSRANSVFGAKGNGSSGQPAISADGKVVAFTSYANNLDPVDSDTGADIFLRNTGNNSTILVSRATGVSGAKGNGNSTRSSVSADGRYVAFSSNANNLDPSDGDTGADVFLRDTVAGTTILVSRSTGMSGAKGNGNSGNASISADGRYVAFSSNATNLDPADDNGGTDIYLRDTVAATTTLVSRTDGGAGAKGNGVSGEPSISADGRYIAFTSKATNFDPDDSDGLYDVYLRDTATASTMLLARPVQWGIESDLTDDPEISGDGAFVVFSSAHSNLTLGDANSRRDVFMTPSGARSLFTWYDNVGGSNWILAANPAGAGGDAWFDLTVAGSGQTLTSLSGQAAGQVPAGESAAYRYSGLMGGPVDIGYHASDRAFTSQRILWPAGGNSLEEVLGTEATKLSDHFYWPWYDQQSAGFTNWVLVSNPNASQVYYEIRIHGSMVDQGTLEPGAKATPTFPGTIGAPVEAQAWTDAGKAQPALIMASQRVLTNYGMAFNEVPGIPAAELSNRYVWTWYDSSAGARNWILIANPPTRDDGVTASDPIYYRIRIQGADKVACSASPIAAGDHVAPIYNGEQGGPVEVSTYADPGCSAIAARSIVSQRSLWGPSFEEVPGYPRQALDTVFHWTWYDEKAGPGVRNWVLTANLSSSITIYYRVYIKGAAISNCKAIAPGSYDTPRFPGTQGGPVEVRTFSDSHCTTPAADPLALASQRVIWNGHFNEVLGTTLD
ncbi:MAG: hypothetical protein C4534_07670 [Gaiellales bacterium]|nr:MAG: hypothetical protein C4534_07670 [Gaiellales bacterium]